MSDQQWTPGDDDTNSGGGAPPPPPPSSGGPPAGGPGGATTSAGPDLGKRFLARLIDWVILWVVYMVLGFIVFAAAVSDAASGGGMMGGMFGGFSFAGIILGLLPGAYFIGMLAYNDGKTIGKAILGLQVQTTDGGSLDIGRAFQREWWNLLVVIPFVGGLAAAGMAIFIAVTINNNQPWHDQQANTSEILTK